MGVVRTLAGMLFRVETPVIVLVLAAVTGVGAFVHSTMTEVREGLPAEVLSQQGDIAKVLDDLAQLVRAAELASLNPQPERIKDTRARLAENRQRIQRIRLSYNFDNLIGASAVHAVVRPALQDIRRWLSDGLYGNPPSHPALLRLVHQRAKEAHRRVGQLFATANNASVRLLEAEARRIESFRVSMISYLIVFGLLAVGVVVLFVLQRNSRSRLDRERRRLRDSIESINEGFALYDRGDRLVVYNQRFREFHGGAGVTGGVKFGTLCEIGFGAQGENGRRSIHREFVQERLQRHRNPGKPYEIVNGDGRTIRISEHRTREGGVVGIYTDVTDLKQTQEQLRHLAAHDPLTGLMNRPAFREPVLQTLAQRRRDGGQFALLVCNLDRFKLINDSYGPGAGDQLLKMVAAKLCGSLRESDTVARIGGDEFAAILHEVNGWKEAAVVAQRALASLDEPIELDGEQVLLSCSIGIAVFPQDGEDFHTLLRSADAACQHAKRRGRNGYQFYTDAMNTKAAERLEIEQQLKTALRDGELYVHYQPQMDLVSGRIAGVEALLRWSNPRLGQVPPDRFIPIAEETGLILPLGAWVLRQACLAGLEWQRHGLGPLTVSVNISPRQFQDEQLSRMVAGILKETGMDPGCLVLEITENAIMENMELALRTLHRLSDMGVGLAIDDFGTGYSSLSVLRQYPLDSLKIDGSFVRDLADNTDDREIVSAVVALAHNLGLKVVAEGVETREQLALLRARGCDLIQGYYLGRPMSAEALSDFLTSGFRSNNQALQNSLTIPAVSGDRSAAPRPVVAASIVRRKAGR